MTDGKTALQTFDAMRNVAQDYGIGAGVLLDRINAALAAKRDNGDVALGSFLMLAVLHLELLLKCLLFGTGRPAPTKHDFLLLYNTLDEGQRRELLNAYAAVRSPDNGQDLVTAFGNYSRAFVEWRYAYEHGRMEASIPVLREMTLAVEARVRAVRSQLARPQEGE